MMIVSFRQVWTNERTKTSISELLSEPRSSTIHKKIFSKSSYLFTNVLLFRIPTCSGQPGLTGKRLDFPRKIVLLFLFGFEADILEIALKQQHDLVDKIFLVESSQSHRGVGLLMSSLSPIYSKTNASRQQNPWFGRGWSTPGGLTFWRRIKWLTLWRMIKWTRTGEQMSGEWGVHLMIINTIIVLW